jgi:hypothetical protein
MQLRTLKKPKTKFNDDSAVRFKILTLIGTKGTPERRKFGRTSKFVK